jgi:uncharacterized protein with ATP-grasp and redox domains
MQTQPECLECFLRQSRLTAQKVTDNQDLVFETVQEVSKLLPTFSQQLTPAESATLVNKAAAEYLGVSDPFKDEKETYNRLALKIYPHLKEYVDQAKDNLYAAVRVAAMGNALDLSVVDKIDLDELLAILPKTVFAIDHYSHFRSDVSEAKHILYLGDNAGEIVFDRVLIEALPAGRSTFAVKSGPVVNDVTYADAYQVGLDKVTQVIDTGIDYAGIPLNLCSQEFRNHFERSDVIISKGQANYETLSNTDANIYFVLKTKCNCVSRDLGVQKGDIVIKSQRAGGSS